MKPDRRAVGHPARACVSSGVNGVANLICLFSSRASWLKHGARFAPMEHGLTPSYTHIYDDQLLLDELPIQRRVRVLSQTRYY